jgi:hypothetical protein
MKEAKIQSKIRNYLAQEGWMVQKQETSKNGFPDLMAIGVGEVIFIEVKATGKKPRPLQIEVIKQINDREIHANWFDDFDKFRSWYHDNLELNHNLKMLAALSSRQAKADKYGRN